MLVLVERCTWRQTIIVERVGGDVMRPNMEPKQRPQVEFSWSHAVVDGAWKKPDVDVVNAHEYKAECIEEDHHHCHYRML